MSGFTIIIVSFVNYMSDFFYIIMCCVKTITVLTGALCKYVK